VVWGSVRLPIVLGCAGKRSGGKARVSLRRFTTEIEPVMATIRFSGESLWPGERR